MLILSGGAQSNVTRPVIPTAATAADDGRARTSLVLASASSPLSVMRRGRHEPSRAQPLRLGARVEQRRVGAVSTGK
jgi:hypothetical protein